MLIVLIEKLTLHHTLFAVASNIMTWRITLRVTPETVPKCCILCLSDKIWWQNQLMKSPKLPNLGLMASLTMSWQENVVHETGELKQTMVLKKNQCVWCVKIFGAPWLQRLGTTLAYPAVKDISQKITQGCSVNCPRFTSQRHKVFIYTLHPGPWVIRDLSGEELALGSLLDCLQE